MKVWVDTLLMRHRAAKVMKWPLQLVLCSFLVAIQSCVMSESPPPRDARAMGSRDLQELEPTSIGLRPHRAIEFQNICTCRTENNVTEPYSRHNIQQCTSLCDVIATGREGNTLILDIQLPPSMSSQISNINQWCNDELGDGFLNPSCNLVYQEATGFGSWFQLDVNFIPPRFVVVPLEDFWIEDRSYNFKLVETRSGAETVEHKNYRIGSVREPLDNMFPQQILNASKYHCKDKEEEDDGENNEYYIFQFRQGQHLNIPAVWDCNNTNNSVATMKVFHDFADKIDSINDNFVIDLDWNQYPGSITNQIFRPLRNQTVPEGVVATIGYYLAWVNKPTHGNQTTPHCPTSYDVTDHGPAYTTLLQAIGRHTNQRPLEPFYEMHWYDESQQFRGVIFASQSWLRNNGWYYRNSNGAKHDVGNYVKKDDILTYEKFYVDINVHGKDISLRLKRSDNTQHAFDHRVGCSPVLSD